MDTYGQSEPWINKHWKSYTTNWSTRIDVDVLMPYTFHEKQKKKKHLFTKPTDRGTHSSGSTTSCFNNVKFLRLPYRLLIMSLPLSMYVSVYICLLTFLLTNPQKPDSRGHLYYLIMIYIMTGVIFNYTALQVCT